jgi:hypothetical protein
MKLSAYIISAMITGLTVIIVLMVTVLGYSPDTMQQSGLACDHAAEVLTGKSAAYSETDYNAQSVVYSGQVGSKDIVCKTSLWRGRIVKLSIGGKNKLPELERRDIRFNPSLDYFHDHKTN